MHSEDKKFLELKSSERQLNCDVKEKILMKMLDKKIEQIKVSKINEKGQLISFFLTIVYLI